MKLTDALEREYFGLFDSCTERELGAVLAVTRSIVANTVRYRTVETATGVPWFVIGILHSLEANFSFDKHLHNGDPLTERTRNVPSGRPQSGTPPFTWEQSAIDALQYDKLTEWDRWDVAGILFKLEGFNGFGYRQYGVNSPYLWAGSKHYTQGKFVADGKWSASTVSKQIGGAVLLRRMGRDYQIALRARLAKEDK